MNAIYTALRRARAFALAHKLVTTIVAVIALWGIWYAYGAFTAPSTVPRYVTSNVATGTVIATMSETGQVSASSNVDVQSKSSGAVLSISVTAGEHIYAGQALAYLDSTTAAQNVTSAKQALQSAEISLATTQQTLSQAHDTGYKDVAATFLNLASVVTGLDTVLHGTTIAGHTSEQNVDAYSNIAGASNPLIGQYRDLVKSTYQTAYDSYSKALGDFKTTQRTADATTIAKLVTETYNAVLDLSDALRASTNFLDSINTTIVGNNSTAPSALAGHLTALAGYTTTTNTYVATLSTDVTKIGNDTTASQPVSADPLNIQVGELSVQMKKDALGVAEQALADTVVRAPFSGTVGKLNVQQYQTIGSGTSVATLVSDNQSVNISVNEVDAAKLKVGEKATITFDALPNVSIAGTVSSVNSIGTVTSGVVSYAAVVTFDTPNGSVKPGMSATTNIITGMETGLVVPSSAVKTSNGQSYVLVFNPPLPAEAVAQAGASGVTSTVAPTRTIVTTGLTDNANVIIRSGLEANQQIVTKTITGTATTATAAQNTSLFGIGGVRTGGAGGGGTVRTTGSTGAARAPGQ